MDLKQYTSIFFDKWLIYYMILAGSIIGSYANENEEDEIIWEAKKPKESYTVIAPQSDTGMKNFQAVELHHLEQISVQNNINENDSQQKEQTGNSSTSPSYDTSRLTKINEEANVINFSMASEKSYGIPVNSTSSSSSPGEKKKRSSIKYQKCHEYPWSAQGHLSMQYKDANGNVKFTGGSATVIGDNILLTAAHNIFIRNDLYNLKDFAVQWGAIPKQIIFFPGLDASSDEAPVLSYAVKKAYLPSYWINSEKKYVGEADEFDFAILILKDHCSDYTGCLGPTTREQDLSQLTVNVTGYPGDLPADTTDKTKRAKYAGKVMHNVQGCLLGKEQLKQSNGHNTFEQHLYYDHEQIATSGGHSGGAIWTHNGDLAEIRGVHTSTVGTQYNKDNEKRIVNRGIHLNKDKINLIKRWIKTEREWGKNNLTGFENLSLETVLKKINYFRKSEEINDKDRCLRIIGLGSECVFNYLHKTEINTGNSRAANKDLKDIKRATEHSLKKLINPKKNLADMNERLFLEILRIRLLPTTSDSASSSTQISDPASNERLRNASRVSSNTWSSSNNNSDNENDADEANSSMDQKAISLNLSKTTCEQFVDDKILNLLQENGIKSLPKIKENLLINNDNFDHINEKIIKVIGDIKINKIDLSGHDLSAIQSFYSIEKLLKEIITSPYNSPTEVNFGEFNNNLIEGLQKVCQQLNQQAVSKQKNITISFEDTTNAPQTIKMGNSIQE